MYKRQPPYQAGIEAGAATVMSCFNDISGTPGTANPYILTEVLKERWAHDGFVVSDWAAIEQLRSQGVATDRKEAAEKAAMKYHRIKSGDTLGAIARRYGTTVNNICRMNNIKSTTVLRIGRSLRVR